MRLKREPVPRARAAGHWLGGILLIGILAGGVIAAAVLLWENLDLRQLAPGLVSDPGRLPDPEPPAPPGIQPGTFPVVLFNSPRNRQFFPDEAYYPQALGRWRGLVEGLGGHVRAAVSVEDLRTLTPLELLVLPEAPCLSGEEVSAIHDHVEGGGGLVSNWAVGARDENCEWRGFGTVRDLTGAADVRELAVREALYITVPGGMALSPGLDPGTRIEFRSEPSLALKLPGPRIFWSDWALNPTPDESGGGADVSVATSQNSAGGRTAWFGFRLSQAATPRDSVSLDRLVQNGILWAAGRAMAAPAPWPNGKRSALLLIEDVEAEYQKALALAALLEDLDLPGTFFVVSRLVLDDPELGHALARVGEVGSHTSDHNPVAGLTYQDQAIRLRRSWTEIRGWTGSPPEGMRPPEESFDANTLRAWGETGGRYVLAVNQARSGSPEVHLLRGGGTMVLLPRLMKDDYNVFVQEGALRTDRLSEAFLEGAEKMRAIGGLAVVAVHTQIVGAGRRLDAVRAVADTAVAQGDWWIAEAGDVADWWRARAGVRLTAVPPQVEALASSSPGSLEGIPPPEESVGVPSGGRIPDFLVEGPEGESVTDLWIDIVLPGGSVAVTPFVDGVPVAYTTTDWGIRVPVGDLPAGENRLISLRVSTPLG